MTDKKLTDQEIIKRLEIASCIDAVRNDALDLIKRLQAKVEFSFFNRSFSACSSSHCFDKYITSS